MYATYSILIICWDEIRACITSSSPLSLKRASVCLSWTANQGSQRPEWHPIIKYHQKERLNEGFTNRGVQGKVICSVYALTLNTLIHFLKTLLFPNREHDLILRVLQERVDSFWADGVCKLYYISKRDIFVTIEIKQYIIKHKENLALSYVIDKILFTCYITASPFCMQVSFYYWCHLFNSGVSLTWLD